MTLLEDTLLTDGRACCSVVCDGVPIASFFGGDEKTRRASARFYMDCVQECIAMQYGRFCKDRG